jgi:hypothetical protein
MTTHAKTQQKLKTALLDVAIERLEDSREEYEAELCKRGYSDGVKWAMRIADYSELAKLAANFKGQYDFYDDDDENAPEVFLRFIGEDSVDDDAIDYFWTCVLGKSDGDSGLYESEYWGSFSEGALSMYKQV